MGVQGHFSTILSKPHSVALIEGFGGKKGQSYMY